MSTLSENLIHFAIRCHWENIWVLQLNIADSEKNMIVYYALRGRNWGIESKALKKNFWKKNFDKKMLKKKFWEKNYEKKNLKNKLWEQNLEKKNLGKKFRQKKFEGNILEKKIWKKNSGKKILKKNVGKKRKYRWKAITNESRPAISRATCSLRAGGI